MPTFTALLLATLCLLAPGRAEANPLCRWLGFCFYMSPGFELTVVDADTGNPLPGVYAWAEWVQYGGHGLNGPLMVLQAVSGADGRLVFPRWGPRLGSRGGIDPGADPAVLIYRPAYAVLIVGNKGGSGFTDQRSAYRPFVSSGDTVRLQKFSGTVPERLKQLEQVKYSPHVGRMSDAQAAEFREQYFQRFDLIDAELTQLPAVAEVAKLRSSIQRNRRTWTGERR